jgi:hypothetical protein
MGLYPCLLLCLMLNARAAPPYIRAARDLHPCLAVWLYSLPPWEDHLYYTRMGTFL